MTEPVAPRAARAIPAQSKDIPDLAAGPLVITGGANSTVAAWPRERIIGRFGDRPCRISLDSRHLRSPLKETMTVAEYLSYLDDEATPISAPKYLFQTDLSASDAASLLAELELPAAVATLGLPRLSRFYAGPALSGTLPHVHGVAVNALLTGVKRWVVYAGSTPDQTHALLADGQRRYGNGSQASDWFSVEYPRLQREHPAVLYEFIQRGGDVVVVPPFMIHAVVNLAPVIGFTIELDREVRPHDRD